MLRNYRPRARTIVLPLLVLLICFITEGYSQTFSSGSNGSDGALNLTTPGTILLDPTDTATFGRVLDPDGDNVYNFTTINIASGVTLLLSSKKLTGPIMFLATGTVQISGTIKVDGEPGAAQTASPADRIPAAGGAGGYFGGVGGAIGTSFPPEPGNGPGGGAAATAPQSTGAGGTFTGNSYLIPLVGGSGGGGGTVVCGAGATLGGGGGGGGGALLIASSAGMVLDSGTISANGGAGGKSLDGCGNNTGGGGGSGGSIRLIAPSISCPVGGGHSGFLVSAVGGVSGSGFAGGSGHVRLETSSAGIPSGCVVNGSVSTSTPFSVAPPATPPSTVKVISLVVGGVTIPINANPFSFPDAVFTSATAVIVNVEAQYIPTGTVPKILVLSETGPDQTVICSALQGALQRSTCSASIPFPTGGSRGFVKATWTP